MQQKPLSLSVKQAVLTALVVVFTIALAGCGGNAQELVDWEPPKKPTTPQQDIVVGYIECTGIFPCRDQFAAVVTSKVATGDIALNNHETYVLDITTALRDILSGNKPVSHGVGVGYVIETYGSGAKVNYAIQYGSDIGLWRIPKSPVNVIINRSLGKAFKPRGITYHRFDQRNAILVQPTGNEAQRKPSHCHNDLCWSIHEKIAKTGRLIMVTGFVVISNIPTYAGVYAGLSGCEGVEQYCISAKGINAQIIYEGRTHYVSGTSFAAPLVTASLQLLSAMWPYLSQEELVQLVLALAEDRGDPGADYEWGRGTLSFRKLFTQQGLMGFKCNMITCVDTNIYS